MNILSSSCTYTSSTAIKALNLLLAHHLYETKLSFHHFLVEKKWQQLIYVDREKYCKEIKVKEFKANKKSLIHSKYHISKKTYYELKEK